MEAVYVLGAAMTKFGRFPDRDLIDLGAEASMAALDDSGVTMKDMQVFTCGNTGEAAGNVGQRIQKQIGQYGTPVFNVTNACATGATAVRTAILAIQAGAADMGLALGVEVMGKQGLLGSAARPKADKKVFVPAGRYDAVRSVEGVLGTGLMPGIFAQVGTEYALRNEGVGFEQFAKVAVKNHEHSSLNPLAQYRSVYSLSEVMEAEMIGYPNTKLMCCPNADGGAAVVLVSEKKLKGLDPDQRRRAVKISASVLTTDPWSESGLVQPDVNTLTRNAADAAYETSGIGPEDMGLVELHDCFATAELVHYDNLRLCEPGGAGEFIDSGRPQRTGSTPVNVSGGLISKGHPIGATGVAGIFEIATHLRGEAGDRQIPDAKVGMAHVIGLGSACGVHILERCS